MATKAIVGEKVGMTQVWDDQNRAVPVTVVRVSPVRVVQVKTPEKEGYGAPGFNPGVGLDSANAEMGVGVAVVNGSGSFVDLIEAPSGAAPAMTFTWAQNVLPYL